MVGWLRKKEVMAAMVAIEKQTDDGWMVEGERGDGWMVEREKEMMVGWLR